MWVFNVWLFLCFFFAPSGYKEMVANGEPCYAYVSSLGTGNSPQPTCWYDPTNINLGK